MESSALHNVPLRLITLDTMRGAGLGSEVPVPGHRHKQLGRLNKYVRTKIGLFDPPLPLVRKMTSLLLHSLHSESLFTDYV